MGSIIAVISQKGGTGKTTLAVNLACALVTDTAPVLVVDADPQGSALHWAKSGGLPVEVFAAVMENPKREAASWSGRLLSRAKTTGYLVLDSPPHTGDVTQSVAVIADAVLVPCGASNLDLAAVRKTVELVRAARLLRKDKGPRCLLVPSRVDQRTLAGRELTTALNRIGEAVSSSIGQRAAFADSATGGYWIGEFAPNSTGHQEIMRLADQVRELLGGEGRKNAKRG